MIGIDSINPFEGNFDGNGANFDLNINAERDNVGLFGYIAAGSIKNLSTSGNIKGHSNVGGVVGYQASGDITNVYNTANVEAVNNYAGGIVGYKNGEIGRAHV